MPVQHFLENSAARLPGKVALICGEERLSYSGIDEQTDQLASALIDLGIERQDRVIIFMDNAAESVISLFGGRVVLEKSLCKRISDLPPDQLGKRPDSVGIPIPNEEVLVVDENGRELTPGQVGELVAAPTLCRGTGTRRRKLPTGIGRAGTGERLFYTAGTCSEETKRGIGIRPRFWQESLAEMNDRGYKEREL